MKASEVRKSFLDYFKNKGHAIVPSASVAPVDDPTLLFTNAGMNQFKNIFIGLEEPQNRRVADTQKCIRVSGKHNDLEDVGFDTYHHTFFEMLGNWSFGDYYKKEAIEFAWELLTEVWKLPKNRIFVTVYRTDDEAADLWTQVTDIEPERVMRFDEKDNFWEMGETGPCGPCSEIHFDTGDLTTQAEFFKHPVEGVNGENARFIELWNLVFIQYNREKDGKLTPLKDKHVDTGMGFERIVAVIQNKTSNYDTDIFTPLIEKITEISGIAYSDDGMAHRVIADHVRTLTFSIGDGVIPSNDGRGYVMRRILRRAARFGRNLGLKDPFIYTLVDILVKTMGEAFPELVEKAEYIARVIEAEEESFNHTLDRGLEIFEKIRITLTEAKSTEIGGDDAFKLYDTYGFPLDLTELMAKENNLTVDVAGFNTAMEAQRERARQAGKFAFSIKQDPEEWGALSEGEHSLFIGYENLQAGSEIRKLRQEEGLVYFTLSETPFYAESGGQIGDIGTVSGPGFEIEVTNTQKAGSHIVHIGKLVQGTISTAQVQATVDVDSRLATARNHTTTHLLHKALRSVLGNHVSQAGSLVDPERLRFDVTHFQKIEPAQLEEIEGIVNEQIRNNLPVESFSTSFDEARDLGAMAIFSEKYGDVVRVIKIADYSLELCGGTHLTQTGQAGMFRILSEGSAAAGIRRIEAVTGFGVESRMRSDRELDEKLRNVLQCQSDGIEDKVLELIEQKKFLEAQITELRQQATSKEISQFTDRADEIAGIKYVTSKVEAADVNELKTMSDSLRDSLGSGVGVLAAAINGKVSIVCIVTDDLIQTKKLRAGDIIKEIALLVGGSGGGRPHMALAGGKDVEKIDIALTAVPAIIEKLLK
ncbi:MAG: alanine--tRNA ligase [Calditrichaeota bacterium]|nr:MAG: alanine--tRNA ligase [Calditrichota bacterium]